MSAIDRLLEGRRAKPPIGVDEIFALGAAGDIGIDDRLDSVGHVVRRDRGADDRIDRRLLVGRATERDLVDLLAIPIDTDKADTPRAQSTMLPFMPCTSPALHRRARCMAARLSTRDWVDCAVVAPSVPMPVMRRATPASEISYR
jgi:hypothetical protein